jgi:pSer/pThr/pTyr-binding forkhead associated (FHA) protein
VWIDDESVSRRHARIRVQADSAVLEDLGSKNGTFLGGNRLTGPEELRDGDEIRFGTVAMRWRVFAGQVSTTSVAPD